VDNEHGDSAGPTVQSWDMGDDPHVHLENLKFNYGLRRILFLVVLGGSLFSAAKLWSELNLYLKYSEPTEIGNIRDIWVEENNRRGDDACVQGCPDALKLKNGSFVRMNGFVPTMTRTDQRHFNEFFCPLFNMVVRTSRTVPAQPLQVPEIDGRFVGLVSKRRARMENLMVDMTVEGLLYKADEAPIDLKDSIWSWENSDYPRKVSWFLVDGFDPSIHKRVVWIYLGAIFLVLSSFVFMYRSRRRYLNFREFLNQ